LNRPDPTSPRAPLAAARPARARPSSTRPTHFRRRCCGSRRKCSSGAGRRRSQPASSPSPPTCSPAAQARLALDHRAHRSPGSSPLLALLGLAALENETTTEELFLTYLKLGFL
jgi:hypothetical protein